jgi:hypothetical protein
MQDFYCKLSPSDIPYNVVESSVSEMARNIASKHVILSHYSVISQQYGIYVFDSAQVDNLDEKERKKYFNPKNLLKNVNKSMLLEPISDRDFLTFSISFNEITVEVTLHSSAHFFRNYCQKFMSRTGRNYSTDWLEKK